MAKAKLYTAPAGIAVFPRLNVPDTKFDPDGVFKTGLAYSSDDESASKLVGVLTDVRDEAYAVWKKENPKKAKAPHTVAPVAHDELDDEGDETGRVIINFKMKHKVVSKRKGKTFTFRPRIVDSNRKELSNPPNIGGGSTLRVSFEARPYFNDSSKTFGLSLRIYGVQIVELVEFGGGGNGGFDDDIEGGFTGSSENFQSAAQDDDENTDGGFGSDDQDGDDF